ncbi:MAG: carboxypeptidase-like regulatory domain-containing protein, partial [Candidatus Aminicenantes bacterium]|nr:carboxypeptidase-like regulatory domain-containing protein [Candidatus Aminicenantes bacterium]
MRFKFFVFFTVLLLLLSPFTFSQSKETGAIVGTIVDEEGTSLPGVTVTLSSPKIMGERVFITDAEGEYRFPALPPGLYTVKAEIQGFTTEVRENIRLHTTIRLTVDMTMRITSLEEEITVVALSPTVDVKTSETASVTLSDELLRALPSNQFVTGIVNMAPGVTSNVAYGSSSDTGISYQVDGVDVSDPEGGSAWVFLDYNILEEAKVMGIGLNSEYGAFTGVIFNTITKSGGNEFSGHAEFIFQDTKKGFWTAENNKEYIDDFPDLESPVKGALDTSFHLGGPIKKDKVWFFGGFQYARLKERPAGFPEFWDRMMPRGFLKISSQLSSRLNMSVFYEHDEYTVDNRRASATHPPETCVHQTSPDDVGNFNLTYILSPKTFFDIKASFFLGIYYLDPYESLDTTALWSAEQNTWLYNSNWWYKADRSRYQANASLSHYAEDFIKG